MRNGSDGISLAISRYCEASCVYGILLLESGLLFGSCAVTLNSRLVYRSCSNLGNFKRSGEVNEKSYWERVTLDYMN